MLLLVSYVSIGLGMYLTAWTTFGKPIEPPKPIYYIKGFLGIFVWPWILIVLFKEREG